MNAIGSIAIQKRRMPAGLIDFAERGANAIRTLVGINDLEPLNPFLHSEKLGIHVLTSSELNDLCVASGVDVSSIRVKAWSGGGIAIPGGRLIVALNPSQTPERATVTVMEEVAHKQLGHQPTQLMHPLGCRSYDERSEQEAFWTAAASLLPAIVISTAVWRGRSPESVASEFGTSVDLVKFRIKTLGLWRLQSS